MKAPLKPRRPSPDEALAIASSTAPHQPSAIATSPPPPLMPAPALPTSPPAEASLTLNLRMRRSTIDAIEAAARGRNQTMKQVVAFALEAAGISVAPADLEDRTPRRR